MLRCHRSFLHPERRRASPIGRAGLRNPSPFELLHRERVNKVFGKRSARLLAVFTTGRPSSSAAGGHRRQLLHGLLHRAAYSTCDVHDMVIVNVVSTESALAADRYKQIDPIYLLFMICEIFAMAVLSSMLVEYMLVCPMFLHVLFSKINSDIV